MRTVVATVAKQQRGAALLIALLVVALATVLIAGLLDRGELAAARTRNLLRNEQVEAFQLGLEAYAARVLLRDREEGQVDTNSDVWSMPLPPTPVPGGTLSGTMRDLDGCFNLNNLADKDSGALWMQRFRRLLTVQGLDTHIADALKDWLDAGADPEDGGAEDNAYLTEQPPYRAANRALAHVSELRLVRGVSGEAYARLAPYVCAVPAGNALNLNTASVPVLRSLRDDITDAIAQRLWQRGQAHWSDREAFLHELHNQNVELDQSERQQLGVQSRYFLARGDIELDGLDFHTQSLIERGPGRLRVLQRGRAEE
jgi:general secretion pathway protein K